MDQNMLILWDFENLIKEWMEQKSRNPKIDKFSVLDKK